MVEQTFKLGIDISKWQGTINWNRVKNESEVAFVIHRIGYGAGSIDGQFPINALACQNLQIPSGGYWFSYAYNVEMAEKEAMYAANAISKYFPRTFVAYDAEYDTINRARKAGVNIDKTLLTSMAIAFLSKISELGFIPVLYTNRDYFSRMFIWSLIKAKVPECRLWWATYTTGNLKKAEEEIVDAWQYSSKGEIPGIKGNVDLDRIYPSFFGEISQQPEVILPTPTTVPNINIRNFQVAFNADGGNLSLTGLDDAATEEARKSLCILYKKGWTKKEMMSGYVVRWVQQRLKEMGSRIAVDGIYGPYTENAVRYFQEKHLLTVDGIVGPKTTVALFWN